jgi:hypothetical protein
MEIALGIVLPVLILLILPELFLIAGLALLIFLLRAAELQLRKPERSGSSGSIL